MSDDKKARPPTVPWNTMIDTTSEGTRGIGIALSAISEQIDYLIALLEATDE